MESNQSIINLILDFGLTHYEINALSISKAISYIRHYSEKKEGKASIVFRGFSENETIRLTNIARAHNLLVKSNQPVALTFLCSPKKNNLKYIETAKAHGTKVITKEEFEIIFPDNISNYDLHDNTFLYELSVNEEFRIAKPLSNFNKTVKVKSFSFYSDKVYDVNLFEMTCSCPDFHQGMRSRFNRGDIRRLCKHLMSEYKNRFGLFGLSQFIVQAFKNCYPIKMNLEKVILESYGFEIIVNYDDNSSWWAVYVQDQNGIYTRYGYNPVEKQFSYFERPRGLVTQLKLKFKEIHNRLNNSRTTQTKKNRHNDKSDENSFAESDGCIYLIIIVLIALILSWIF